MRATSDHPPHKTVVIVPGNLPKGRGKPDRDEPPNHQAETAPADLNGDRCEHGRSLDDTTNNHESEMEIKQNPVFPIPDLVQKSTVEIFNDQLKEIDQAINYIPYGDNNTE
jgi:hypothetical protein